MLFIKKDRGGGWQILFSKAAYKRRTVDVFEKYNKTTVNLFFIKSD